MEPQINVELIKMYFRATRQGTDIYATLIEQYLTHIDDTVIETLPSIAPLLLGMVGVCHYTNGQSVTMHMGNGAITTAMFMNGDEMLSLVITDETVVVKYPEWGVTIPTDKLDIESELIGRIIADAGSWNIDTDHICVIIDYLMAVQTLLNPRHSTDVLDILENNRQDALDTATRFDKIITHYTVDNIDDETGLAFSDEQYQDTVTKQYDMSDVESGLTPEQLAENIKDNKERADSINSDLTKAFLDEFSEIAKIVKTQTGSPIEVFLEDTHTLKLVHGGGVDETVWALVTKPGCPAGTYFMRPATSDIKHIQYLDMSSRVSMIDSFAKIIETNTGGIVHDTCGLNKVIIDDFIKIVLNIMASGVPTQDIHLPSEEPKEDPSDTTNDKIKKLAIKYMADIGIEFNENKQVKILDSLDYQIHRLNSPTSVDSEGCTSFVDLIARAYAADLIHNSRVHNSNTLKQFVLVYVNSLVSINWNPQVLQALDPSIFRNQPNWVTTYGFDKIIEAITKHWYPHEQLNIGEVDNTSNLIVPTSNATTDIRNHLNSNQVLGDVPHGVTKLSSTATNGKVTNYRYIRIPAHKDHTGGDTLVVYIEMTSELIRIVPIYTDSKTNKVDSLNVFVSIRETDWPNIMLYLDMVLNQTTSDADDTK